MSHKIARILLLFALGLSSTRLRGDDKEVSERFLQTNLRGKILALRHFYDGAHLEFDAEGNLKKGGDICPWTLCAQIEISEVNLQSDKVEIKGRRILLEYKEDLKHPSGLKGSHVSIEVEIPPNTVKIDTLLKSLDQVFLSKHDHLVDVVPSYWKQFLSFISSGMKTEDIPLSSNGQPVQKVEPGKGSPPREIFAPSPDFSREARGAGYQGTVTLSMVVNTQGNTEQISIVRPLGMGLDDKAVEKVQTWKFKPAMRDGSAVPVKVLLEVTFRM